MTAERQAVTGTDRTRLERDRHVAFAFAAADLLLEAGSDRKVLVASGAARSIMGRDPRGLVGTQLEDLAIRADRLFLRRLLDRAEQQGRIDPSPVRLARPDGSGARVLLGGCCLPNLPGRFFLSATLLPDVLVSGPTERDDATGLLTKEGLIAAAERAAGDSGGDQKQLKLVQLTGLSGAAQRLTAERSSLLMEEIGAAIRAQSVAGDSAGRIDEDSFGFVQSGKDDARRDGALIADIKAVIRAAGVPEDRIASTVASVDLALGTLSGEEAGRAIAYAMTSFVRAKGEGFTIRSLESGLALAVTETVSRFEDVRKIITDGEFTLVYQPVVDLGSRKLHHFEALSRFPGNRNPFETIVFSEKVGLVAELDLAVCRRAIEQIEGHKTAHIAVNLSGSSVQSDQFRQRLGEIVRPLNHLRSRLLFELTESAAVEDLEEAATFLRWLRKIGHVVCLDDFGAGAAAYSYLRRFDVDFVKIDGPFLKAAVENVRERALIHSICILCTELECQVIGEMIEDDKTAGVARTLGIEFGQGWLFGKPLTELPAAASAPIGSGRRRGVYETWQ
jgi:EAL domain-containing protein (putative c-di-GMP-specific phosphodiesterase class I)